MNMGCLACLLAYTLVAGVSKQSCKLTKRWKHISKWAIRGIWLELLTCNFQSHIILPGISARLNHTLNGNIFQLTDILNYQSGHFTLFDIKTIVTYNCLKAYKYNLICIQSPNSWWQEFTSSQCVVPPQSHISTSIQHLILDCSYVICPRRCPGWWWSRPCERFSFKSKSKQERGSSVRRKCNMVGW